MGVISAVSEFYAFGMRDSHARRLANVFINNYCIASTPRSGKEPQLKVLKLSEE